MVGENKGTMEENSQTPEDSNKYESKDVDNTEQVELLVNSRVKRATAGNRLHSLLQNEQPDDELELIFAEDEEDTGFLDTEADQSDIQMDSSTDEEDQGPGMGDESEGEKELQKSIKESRLKVKKKKTVMPRIHKRPRTDTVLSHSTPQTKKKIERASWLPMSSDAPIRASSRRTTRQSKQELHVQMMDREIKRLKQLANMEKTAAAKAANKTPPLTQEDRLKEAARVEKANAKSLSRWERAEREREEEQKLRLENLHRRHLEGPVITVWSGMATYVGGKLQKIGNVELVSKDNHVIKKRKLAVDENEAQDGYEEAKKDLDLDSLSAHIEKKTLIRSAKRTDEKDTATISESRIQSPLVPNSELLTPNISTTKSIPQYSSPCLAPPAGLPLSAPPHPFLAPPSFDGSSPVPGLGFYPNQQHYQRLLPSHYQPNFHVPYQNLSALPVPLITERCLRSSLIFTNFSETAIKSRETQLNILFPHLNLSSSRSNSRPTKSSRSKGNNKSYSCAITSYPAKYKDPKTGLFYCNLYAYKQLKKLQKGEIWWSDLTESYMGSGTLNAAKGVPDRFNGKITEIS